MSVDPIPRAEFEGYIRRHEADPFAHTALVDRATVAGMNYRTATDNRLQVLERWQQRMIGALAMLTFLVTAAVGAGVVELLHR